MLTIQDLKKHASKLEGVTDAQLAFIEELSKADEADVVKKTRNTVTGELAQGLEDDFLKITGIEKNAGEAYYDYLKRGSQELINKAAAGNEQLKKLQDKVAELETAAKDKSGDEVLKKQLADAQQAVQDEKSRVEALQAQVKTVEKSKATEVAKIHGDYLAGSVQTTFTAQLAGKTPRPGLDQTAFEELAKARFERALLEAKPERFGNDIRFRKGEEVLKNPADGQRDHTPETFALSLISDLLAPDREQKGGGSGGGGGTGGSGGAFAGKAKSRVEATELINKSLADVGITTSHPEFQEKFDKQWDEMGAAELPLR